MRVDGIQSHHVDALTTLMYSLSSMPAAQINLIPTQELEKRKVNPYVVWFFRVGLYVLIVTYLLVLAAMGYRWYEEQQLSAINGRIEKYSRELKDSESFLAEYGELQSRYAEFSKIFNESIDQSEVLGYIEQTIPQSIILTQITSDAEGIVLAGYTDDYIAINQWQNVIGQSERFTNTKLSEVQRGIGEEDINVDGLAQDLIRFTITADFK